MTGLATKILIAVALIVFQVELAQAQRAGSSNLPKRESTGIAPRSEWRPSVGVMAGVASPEGNNDSAAEFGVDATVQPAAPFGVGLEVTNSKIKASEGNEEFERTLVLAKGLYYFGGGTTVIKDSYAGIGIGPAFLSGGTEAAFAPIVGFDIPLKENVDKYFMSVGANARYTFLGGDEPDALSLNGVVKYWY